MSPEASWLWIDEEDKLLQAKQNILSSRLLCIDTEYDSLRYFQEKLCLLQVRSGEMTYLIDPLAGMDLSFLGEAFADRAILKVLHAGDNDIRILRRDYAFTFRNIFDTYQAALLLGSTRLALSTLLSQFLGVTLVKKKKLQRSKWEIRPLTEAQIAYAVADTMYLEPLYRRLAEQIRSRNLDAEARRMFRQTSRVEWRERPFRPLGYLRIPGAALLTEEERQRLSFLFRWRFRKAREQNRATFLILSDQQILLLARFHASADPDPVAEADIPADRLAPYREEILSVLAEAERAEREDVPPASQTSRHATPLPDASVPAPGRQDPLPGPCPGVNAGERGLPEGVQPNDGRSAAPCRAPAGGDDKARAGASVPGRRGRGGKAPFA